MVLVLVSKTIEKKKDCDCSRQPQETEWVWTDLCGDLDRQPKYYPSFCSCKREVMFHRGMSSGTSVIRGTVPFVADHHYFWEIEIPNILFGTDVMIGVGNADVDYDSWKKHGDRKYVSFLGRDSNSYGYSYCGKIRHDGCLQKYGVGFNTGDVIGVHLDMWHGTLQFYVNGKPQGVAFRNLKKYCILYPMACSTSASSSIRLTRTASFPHSLNFSCMKKLVRNHNTLAVLTTIPGIKSSMERIDWIVTLLSNENEDDEDSRQDEKNYCVFKDGIEKYPFCKSICLTNENMSDNFIDDSLGQVYENIDKGNYNKNVEILKRIHMPESNDDNENLWLTALEPTTSHKRAKMSDDFDENVIKFSTRLTSNLCEVCNSKLTVLIENKSSVKRCLGCLYTS